MAFTESELTFIQNEQASDFVTYLKSVWQAWPRLKYSQARRKASKLWKARKAWLNALEPTPCSLEKNRCETCQSSFHEMWQPPFNRVLPDNRLVPASDADLPNTVVQWEEMLGLEEPLEEQKNDVLCWGCRENQPNQLAHMDYGGCLYSYSYEMGLVDPYDAISSLPPLPASPPSTD